MGTWLQAFTNSFMSSWDRSSILNSGRLSTSDNPPASGTAQGQSAAGLHSSGGHFDDVNLADLLNSTQSSAVYDIGEEQHRQAPDAHLRHRIGLFEGVGQEGQQAGRVVASPSMQRSTGAGRREHPAATAVAAAAAMSDAVTR